MNRPALAYMSAPEVRMYSSGALRTGRLLEVGSHEEASLAW